VKRAFSVESSLGAGELQRQLERQNALSFRRPWLLASTERVKKGTLIADGIGQQVPIRAVDLARTRSHPPWEREQGDAGRDRERRVRVPERVGL
jgi:hypothetical protein